MNLESDVYYKLEQVVGFEDYKKRVIINWGKSILAWHQWLTDKEVIEILPKGYVKEFPGYHDFILDFKELEEIINNPISNKKWFNMLSEVFDIYLIIDKKSGKSYVGSACGQEGIWGRWKEYINTGHGGNKKLKNLLKENDNYKYNFQFTLLRTLPKSLTKKEVIQFENLYKQKLGSKDFGLN